MATNPSNFQDGRLHVTDYPAAIADADGQRCCAATVKVGASSDYAGAFDGGGTVGHKDQSDAGGHLLSTFAGLVSAEQHILTL